MKSTSLYSQEPARGWLPWGLLAPILTIAFVAAPALGVGAVLEGLQLADVKGDPIGLSGLFAFLLIPFSLTGLFVIGWVLLIERRPLATIGLVRFKRSLPFLRGHLIGLVTISAVVIAIWAAGGFRSDGYLNAFATPSSLISIGVLLLCFAVQSSVEEILFRGWLLSVTARKFNIPIGVTITSAVFMLLHYSPHQPLIVSLNTFLFSLFACFWALKAGSIWSVMGWHAGWNWLLATGFELPVTGINANVPALVVRLTPENAVDLTGGAQGPEGSFVCTLFFLGGVSVLAWSLRRGRSQPLLQ